MPDNNTIFETLFSRNFAGTDHVDQLKEVVSKYPYFSPAQFFLLQKTGSGTAAYETQLIKTNLLFNNPHWLHYQLQQTGRATGTEENMLPAETTAVSHDPEPFVEITDFKEPIPEPLIETETVIEINDIKEIIPEPVIETETVININDIKEPIPEPLIETETAIEINDIKETIQEPVLESGQVIDLPDDTDAIPDSVMESEIAPMKIELKMPVEKANPEEEMLFEPMHMVDYFASQGIKLSDEVQMADKLGKQLKSFTEWLKTMKKIHVEQEAETTPETNDNIQMMAEGSNTETEVLTESMAEVFIKQGKLGKALEVYQKLSLLNPAKSAYFAAKLENLKGK